MNKVTVRLDNEAHEQLCALSKANSRSMNGQIIHLIREAIRLETIKANG